MLAPGGDLAQAVVLLGLYSDAMPQGSEQAACDRTDWDEDNYFEWLRGALTAYCMESITLSTPNTRVHMEGSTVTITGGGAILTIGPDRITSNVDIVAQGVSLVHHKHTGVTKGFDLTGAPT